MKKRMLVAILALAAAGSLHAQIIAFSMGDSRVDAGLNELNVSAKADMGAFYADLTLQWGVPKVEVQVRIATYQPAELWLAAALSKLSGKSFSYVLSAYSKNKARGWGALAKDLGIKPGSKEFKALMDKLNASKGKLKKK